MPTIRNLSLAAALALAAAPALAAGTVERIALSESVSASVTARQSFAERFAAPRFCFDNRLVRAGRVLDTWRSCNTVVTAGKNDVLDKYFKGSAYTAGWYLMLKGAGSIAAGDTLASHAGWTESTPYSGNRPGITFGTTSAGSNTATQISISINATATVAGACIASVNTGTSGILYSCSDFASSRSVVSGDTLQITPTVTD